MCIVGLMTGIILGANFLFKMECEQVSDKMGVEHDYGMIKGCFYNINGTWVHSDHYIVNYVGKR